MFEKLKENWQREEVREISRRYFFSNGFDGTLTATGITVGSYLSGVETGFTVFKVAVGAGIGLATSGVWSVWEIEKAEKLAQVHQLEDQMKEKLEDTSVMEQKMQGRKINALSSGIGPVLGVMMPSLPFLIEGIVFTMLQATIASVVLAVLQLSAFGAYMAKISQQDILKSAARMGLAGLVVAALNIILPG